MNQEGNTRYTIELRGTPVAEAEVTLASETLTFPVQPLDGYDSIRPVVRAASCAFAQVALEGQAGGGVSTHALAQGAELGRMLELRDTTGALVPTDFIELTEWPGGSPEYAAFVRLRDANAFVAAHVLRVPATSRDAADPPAV